MKKELAMRVKDEYKGIEIINPPSTVNLFYVRVKSRSVKNWLGTDTGIGIRNAVADERGMMWDCIMFYIPSKGVYQKLTKINDAEEWHQCSQDIWDDLVAMKNETPRL